MNEKFTGNKFKYTEGELRARHVGDCISTRDNPVETAKWRLKKATYTNEGVWVHFTGLRNSFSGLFVQANGFVCQDVAQKCSQIMMDAFLIRRTKGETVSIPKQVVPINAAPDEKGVSLIDGSGFTEKAVSENEKLRWLFENMQVDGLKPEDSPSPGAWALLQELRNNDEQRRDFYKTLWPKLLTKEDTESGGKLQDDGKETIELIKRLQAALPVESEE